MLDQIVAASLLEISKPVAIRLSQDLGKSLLDKYEKPDGFAEIFRNTERFFRDPLINDMRNIRANENFIIWLESKRESIEREVLNRISANEWYLGNTWPLIVVPMLRLFTTAEIVVLEAIAQQDSLRPRQAILAAGMIAARWKKEMERASYSKPVPFGPVWALGSSSWSLIAQTPPQGGECLFYTSTPSPREAKKIPKDVMDKIAKKIKEIRVRLGGASVDDQEAYRERYRVESQNWRNELTELQKNILGA